MAIIKNPLTIVQTGGEEPTTGQYLVQVIDYAGTVLKSANLDTGATFTLPNAPTHEKLIFQEWSSPVTISNNSITVVDSDITIGATYKTTSGLTEIDITLTKVTGLDVVCNMVGNKNWGDGTENSLTTHTYSNYGDYTITCDGTSIPSGTSSSGGMFNSNVSSSNFYCTRVRVGELVTNIGEYAFSYCRSLTSITIPNSVSIAGTYLFNNCTSLTSITIPSSLDTIGEYMFYYCGTLRSIAVPHSIERIAYFSLAYCHSLTSITISNNISEINGSAFYDCNSLQSITMPNVTRIDRNAFASCGKITKYDFTSATAVSTLSNRSAFDSINDICKIVVPDALYDEWISATNWVTYADYIYKASEV